MTKKYLLHIMNPIGFIAGISAIETLHEGEKALVYIIVQWPGSPIISEEILQFIKIFSQEFSHIKKITCDNNLYINKINFDEIYFSHEMNKGTIQPFFESYPQAKKICYGDSLGLVYTKKYFLNSRKEPVKDINFLENFIQLIIEKVSKNTSLKAVDYKINESVLILPVDQSGEFFNQVPLKVCSRNTTLDVINKCVRGSFELKKYIKTILKISFKKKLYILLTENFFEAGLIDLSKEIDMYADIIRKNSNQGDIIFLKPHPGEANNRVQKIQELLPDYRVIEIDKKFGRYPFEIWQNLIKRATIISVAYPILSLKYLYDIDVIQPMNKTLIKKWFPKKSQNYISDAIDQYMKPLKKLKRWNGQEPLYVNKNE
jgi:hypothetical protein